MNTLVAENLKNNMLNMLNKQLDKRIPNEFEIGYITPDPENNPLNGIITLAKCDRFVNLIAQLGYDYATNSVQYVTISKGKTSENKQERTLFAFEQLELDNIPLHAALQAIRPALTVLDAELNVTEAMSVFEVECLLAERNNLE
ncbi:hypothetical protein GCM10007377_15920 [Galliscardovia ingluviei]|uniref:Uncharacterized protein n=1 Tax=Galliscardovia ingluviei TaxID=1769422 RepID=A0A8J3EZM3_9BIFI|nr:hypothetical protein [Galliscardovia ingluviei]GGI15442.1 hypothetical protein GCM10007377_15920 [Galliscardovia ingluviei]